VHNEARHLREVADGVAEQTRPPDLWVIVDDNSTDDTQAVLAEVQARLPFVLAVSAPAGGEGARDKLAACRPEISFNCGLSQFNLDEFTHVGKLDGDIVMPPNYLELILSAFRENSRLGVAGGVFNERDASGEWKLLPTAPEAISPNARLYTRECFESIGGMPSCLGADVITTVRARMKGFSTRTFPELPYKHLRPIGTADGTLRGRYRHGAYQYIVGYGFWWILARSFLVGVRFRPRVLSGLAFFAGYASGLVGRTKRVDDPEFLAYMRYELRSRMRKSIRRRIEQVSSWRTSHGSAAA
jgi:glycosyltransferase involved in cell wall biosynthesis